MYIFNPYPKNYKTSIEGKWVNPDLYWQYRRAQAVSPGEEVPLIKFKQQKSQIMKYDNLITASSLHIVNHKIVSILNQLCPNDVQYCDIKIQCTDGELVGYKIVNILNSVEAVNHELSDFYYAPFCNNTVIGSFKFLVIKPNILVNKGLNIAREAEYRSNIYISTELRDELIKNKVTGISIYTIEDYNNVGYI